jgi:hypothetical protein
VVSLECDLSELKAGDPAPTTTGDSVKLEDQHHFAVRARPGWEAGDEHLELACLRCVWAGRAGDDEWPTLADLEQRGEEHLDAAHGGGS